MKPSKKAISKPAAKRSLSASSKSDKRRGEIIRVAIEIINAKSFAQATMVDIAAALELRDATLYHYFHDKRTLAYACHRISLERAQRLLEEADAQEESGIQKLRRFIRGMLLDSHLNGPLLYLGDYSYLDAPQRRAVQVWADKLRTVMCRFIEQGMADRTMIPCEAELVVQLLLGMLIWLGKWVSAVPDMTVDRLMEAIEAFSFKGLEDSATVLRTRRRPVPGKTVRGLRALTAAKKTRKAGMKISSEETL